MPEITQLPADNIDIRAIQGDTLKLPFDFSADLTGYTFSFDCDCVDTAFQTNLAVGRLEVEFDTTIATGRYPWVLKWTTPNNSIRTLFRGTLEIM